MVRHKNRYMVIELTEMGKDDKQLLQLKNASLYGAIIQTIQDLHGDFGVAATRAGFNAKYCNEKTRIAIIRCRHGPHKLVASSLPFVKMINNKRMKVNTLYSGATVRHCFIFIQRYQERKYREFIVNLKTGEDKEIVKKAFMDFKTTMSEIQ